MTATVLVNGSITARRGVFAAFRAHLNTKHAGSEKYRHEVWHQETRGYGDYLYFQDRPMFDEALWRALQGRDFPGFDWRAWVVTPNVQGQGEDTSVACGRSPAPGG